MALHTYQHVGTTGRQVVVSVALLAQPTNLAAVSYHYSRQEMSIKGLNDQISWLQIQRLQSQSPALPKVICEAVGQEAVTLSLVRTNEELLE
ncbi:unnamed protein product [Timema podura]|uniref:Uncharacterized protein n=1 Tax=Timema podura TaxID=61482 RepID=A0ABN7NF72_TIMPD|nr:unnamed protein product [Timema podura]